MAGLAARLQRVPAEIAFAGLMLLAAVLISSLAEVPFILPSAGTSSSVGVHYFVPLAAVFIWYACSALAGGSSRLRDLTVGVLCYGLVMWIHFNIKIWAPHVNPHLFDELYWRTDQAMRPIVEICIAIREAIAAALPIVDHLYLLAFMALFFISFCLHAVTSPAVFRKVLLAAILLQGLGALAYLAMPALGPFLYERGANPVASDVQAMMLGVYRDSTSGGAGWLSNHGAEYLVAGLAAMPSLHAGCSFLFVWFVWKYEKPLLVVYLPLFAFILVEAVASRWHYIIDLPVGIALARLCIFLAFRLDRDEAPAERQAVSPLAQPTPA